MNKPLRQTLRKLLTGLSLPQEYICVDLRQFKEAFSTFLSFPEATQFANATDRHIFLGYKPLVIGIFFEENNPELIQAVQQDALCMHFQMGDFRYDTIWNGFPASSKSVARLALKRIKSVTLGSLKLTLYEGNHGEHRFLHRFHQFIGDVRESLTKRKAGNVSLEKNLYDQVRIAYALPRNISLISVSDGAGRMNLFPTDLHGPMGKSYYAGSLRINGMANQQVERYKRIVISRMNASAYKETYMLGKNHMADLRDEDHFDLHPERSKTFGFPLPAAMQDYRELQWRESVDVGIHRVHLYDVVFWAPGPVQSELSHIHMYYGQWRVNHHLPTQMLFR